VGDETRPVGPRLVPGQQTGQEDVRQRSDALRQRPNDERPSADSVPVAFGANPGRSHGKKCEIRPRISAIRVLQCVADEKWGDWRPHLAMILSNSTQRPELNCKAITILGDTLMGRGSLYAAQFCYLMAEVGFSQYGCAEAKLVLLGSNHNKSFAHFATNEAIHMTEIYEYARSLNDDDFNLVNFQVSVKSF
jgi:hypothetical protein